MFFYLGTIYVDQSLCCRTIETNWSIRYQYMFIFLLVLIPIKHIFYLVLQKRSDVHENGNIRTSRSSERSYIDIPKPISSSSTTDPSTHYASVAEERLSSSRSNVPTHETNGHRYRTSNEIQGYEDSTDSTQPPIPPRRNRSRPSSTISEQCDA